jgi:2-polyprenyl-3-methyl-5-hydroxy-6-metoxy-1,4-benzoquinol methylase
VTEEISDPLARNRQWWERMPMTYADWQGDERMPQATGDFESIRELVFANSPFFRENFDMAGLKGLRVLDLGCGSGVFSCLLSEAGADVTAVDLTEAAVKLTRDSSKVFGCPVRVAQMNAESLGIDDASFDYVFSWGVLHHTPEPRRAYGEVARILKPGGSGIIMVYHKRSAIYYLLGLYWLTMRGKLLRGYTLETVQGFFTDGFYHRNYTRRAFAEELRSSGLAVDELIVTQMEKKILPLIPAALDRYLKSRVGWLLVARVARPDTPIAADQTRQSRLSASSI